MKLRCLLIDDEPPALKVLSQYVDAVGGLEVVGQCNNAIEALHALQRKTVDVMFLDIKMPRLIGTEFLRNLAHPPKVIFVTAYREYAIDGFDLNAVDYLVKPVSFERFFKAITKLTLLMGLETATAIPPDTPGPSAFVYLKVDREMKKIFVNEISFIESCKDYVMVNLVGGKHFLVKQSITAMEHLLSEHKFLRVHRSFIVSFSKITSYNNLMVKLADREIPIGRLYKQVVMDQLQGD